MNALQEAAERTDRHLLLTGLGARAISEDRGLYEQAVLVASSFRYFTRYWKFRDADSGGIVSLTELWSSAAPIVPRGMHPGARSRVHGVHGVGPEPAKLTGLDPGRLRDPGQVERFLDR